VKTIICAVFLLLIASSYGAVGIPVESLDSDPYIPFNECGETKEQEDENQADICAEVGSTRCEGVGIVAISSTNGIYCLTPENSEDFYNQWELDI